ncbi:MAG: hypothetical protein ABR573_11840 [Candidatus Dormibacteria bacterium]
MTTHGPAASRNRLGALVASSRATALLLALSLGGASPAVAAASTPVLLRDTQASIDTLTGELGECALVQPVDGCFQRDTEAEPSIAVDPTNRDHAVAVFHVGRASDGGAATDGYAVTFDQGRTWTQGLLPGLTIASGGTVQRASDPRVAFGPDGKHVYATAQPYNNDVFPALSSVVSLTSANGGLSWSAPVSIVSDPVSQNFPQSDAYLLNNGFDQPDLAVDLGSGAGHHPGRIYVTWVRLALAQFAYVAYSDDGGASWVKGAGAPTDQGFIVNSATIPLYPRPVVLANGDLAVMDWNANPYTAPPPSYFGDAGPVQADPRTTSLNNQTGGYQLYLAAGAGTATGGTPLVFSPVPRSVAYLANQALRGQRSAEKQPLFAVDHRSGRFYAAWTDARFRTDGGNDIVFTYSDDQGATWRSPQRVNPGTPNDNLNHWCAMIDAGADGVLRLGYRQRREALLPAADFSNFSPSVDTYYVESRDGGLTFNAPLKVSSVASDLGFGAFDGGQTNVGEGGVFLGDYDAMASGDGITYLVRAEPVRTRSAEPAAYPPLVHHQRTWVAVVGEVAGATAAPGPVGGSQPVSPSTSRALQSSLSITLGLLALALAAALARWRRAGDRARD